MHNCTWEEVHKLSGHQCVSDSGAQYDGYDYMSGIPYFSQIVNLLYDWNTREVLLIGRPNTVGQVPGLYTKFKLSQFFLADANVSIAGVCLDKLAARPKASELLFDHFSLCNDLGYVEYKVPPLVVKLFNEDYFVYLRDKFKERRDYFVEKNALYLVVW